MPSGQERWGLSKVPVPQPRGHLLNAIVQLRCDNGWHHVLRDLCRSYLHHCLRRVGVREQKGHDDGDNSACVSQSHHPCGVPAPDVALSVTLIFQGDKLTWVDKDGIHYQEDTIKLMPDQSPRAIDNWSKGLGQAALGIYSLEGDTFRWCSAGGDNKVRPTSFDSNPGSKQSLMLLRRQKK